jgi:ATP-binding cassette subfamily B protein
MNTWRYLFHLLRYRPWLYAFNLLGIVGHLMLDLTTGLLLRQYFNLLTHSAPVRFSLYTMIALLIAASLARFFTSMSLGLTNIPFTFEVGGLLRKNLLWRILNCPGAQALPQSSGEAISRFRDDIDEITGSFLWFNDMLAFGVFSVVGIAIMLRINAGITLTVFVPLILVVVLSNLARKRVTKNREASRKAAGAVAGFLGETLGAVQAIQVAGAEEHVAAYFRKLSEQRRATGVRDRMFNELMNAVFRNTISLGTGMILILSGRTMRAGLFTVGDFALFVFFLRFITDCTSMIGGLMAHYKQMGVSFARMLELMQGAPASELVAHGPVYMRGELPDMPPTKKETAHRLETLEVSGLTFRYPDSDRGVENVDLTLRRGDLTVITGRIGAGKTTLLRALLGLVTPEAGEIRWNGESVADPASFLAPPRCAYTPQVPRLFSESLRDNILLGLPDAEYDLAGAVNAAVLEADLADIPHGLETKIGPRGVRLSGGQVQRTAAARMFVRDAELLVCDDLSSALDVDTEQALWGRVLAQQEATCLVVSHRRFVLQHADHIIVMKEGRVEAQGKLNDLLATSAEMQRIWHGNTGAETPQTSTPQSDRHGTTVVAQPIISVRSI